MTRSRIIFSGSLIFTFLVAGSCQHKLAQQSLAQPSNHDASAIVSQSSEASAGEVSQEINLSKVVETNYLHSTSMQEYKSLTEQAQFFADTYRARGLNSATEAVCKASAEGSICKAFSYEQTPNQRSRNAQISANIRRLTKEFRDGAFEGFADATLDQSLKAMKPLSNSGLLAGAKKILATETCYSSNMLMALGSKLEDGFPSEDYIQSSSAIYSRASKCHSDDSATRAAYRNGMILVWQNKCDQAYPEFDKVLQNKNLSFLHTRSSHWKNHCASLLGKQIEKDAETNYHENPLSFHSIMAFNENQDVVFEKVKNNPEPLVIFRSTKQPKLNDFIVATELMISIGEINLARTALSYPEISEIDQAEPELRLYVSYLMHRTQMNIPKFQVLSKVFVEKPAAKSLTSLKLFYPLWFYDEVSAKSDSIDPFLIISLIRQESAFNPKAKSRAGAMGLMQLLPSTARRVASVPKSKLFEPDQNLKAGVRFFGQLMRKYNGKTYLALAAYNAGPNVVDRWLERYPTENDLLFMDMMPYRETREYAAIILRNYYWYSRLYPQDQVKQMVGQIDPAGLKDENSDKSSSSDSENIYESIDADGLIYYKDRF